MHCLKIFIYFHIPLHQYKAGALDTELCQFILLIQSSSCLKICIVYEDLVHIVQLFSNIKHSDIKLIEN
jgi:hypothetical protein